ncbi:MAG TPA: flagellar basal body P-ring formation chaperone FlgA [Pirellulales bacterium]|jgi:flagella basal body P-ring formation protein FlgA|nr:flagellar basal body P-ring formation chaperone FlgA [Pirellulales bacterium]
MKSSLVITFLIVSSAACAVRAAEIKLRDEVHTSKSLLLLGDIAEIYAADSQEASKLAAIELMPAPAAGNHMVVRLRDVQDLLDLRGINLAQQQFSGAGQISVIRASDAANKLATRRPNKALILQVQRMASNAIVRYLREKVADEAWQVTVELNDEQAQAVAATPEPLAATGGQRPWVGRQPFQLTVNTTDGTGQINVIAQVALPPTIVVATHAVPRGAIVRACDIELQRLSSDTSATGAFQTADEVVGKEAVKAIAPGQTLDANYVRPQVLVHSGEVVTVYGRNAGIVVRMPARAHENGAHGELVNVESMLDRKTFLARVCGLDEVEVFGGAATTSPATLTGDRENKTTRSE